VNGLSYADLDIGDGGTASAALESMLLGNAAMPDRERDALRAQLLDYCCQDTLAMVKVVERLQQLAT
jgi:hypothetical protein